ncbi:hypothetical protein [Turicimonas muris]|uniref:hypothetical protein n=1 Tax=Turicimonas muris TaxID=1796652 RepID=UPI0024317521|nr:MULTISPECIES: hypothetical protein [Bacteria]
MEELKKINAKIDKQQIGKLIGVVLCTFCSAGLLASYSYQKGITACQKAIAKFYPDEYASLTAKVLETFEREGATKF